MNIGFLLAASLLLWQADAGRAASGNAAVEVKPLSGEAIRGDLLSIDAEEIVVGGEAGERRLPLKSVLRVSFFGEGESPPPQSPISVWIELRDGSQLVGVSYAVTSGQATVGLLDGTQATFPVGAVRSARLKSQEGEAKLAKEWSGILDQRASEDLLVIRKSSKLPAAEPGAEERTVVSLDYLGGVLFDIDEATVNFEFDGETRSVKRDRVEGMIYFRAGAGQLPVAACRAIDSLGNTWCAKTAAVSDGRLKIETVAGARHELPLDKLDALDFSAGKVVYLSDLAPESWEWTPFFDASRTPSAAVFYRPRFDEALGGKPLQIGETTFSKGVHLRSRTRIVWRLPGAFRKLQAIAGIDFSADDFGGKSGDVQLVVLGDDKPLLDRRIRGEDGAVELDVDLTGVKRLTVLVDYGGNIDIADFLDLAEARVTK